VKKGFFIIFKEELVRIFTSTRLLLFIFGFPLLLFVYYAALFSKGVTTDLPITLLDLDKSQLSRQLALMVEANPSMKIKYEVTDELEGEKTVRSGNSYALVIIPKDFSRNIQKGSPTNVTCYYNGEFILPAGLIMRDFQLTAGMLAAGAHIETLEQNQLTPTEALNMVQPVNINEHILYNPYTSYSYYLGTAFMPMGLQLIVIVVSIFAFGVDLKYKRGKEMLESVDDKVWKLVLAKALPYTILFFIVGFFMNTFLFYKLGVPMKGSFLGTNLYLLVLILVCQSMGFFVSTIMPSLREALTVGGAYGAVAFSFAGYTFPVEGMSTFIKALNYVFPYHSYMRFLVNNTLKGVVYNQEQKGYLITMAVFICIGALAIPLYYKKLKKGGYSTYE